jgi:uncharacterized Rossmann fold enzyme
MFNVVCERPQNCPAEHVNVLRDMVSRNLPEGMEGRFVCFSFKGDDLDERITYMRSNYDPSHFEGEKTLVLPLGTVIIGPLDKIASHPIFDEKIPSLWELSALFPGQIVNYREGEFPRGAKIVIFRDKLPWQCTDWVKEVYKIGGGTVPELEFVSNVTQERLAENIISAHQRKNATWLEDSEPHSGIAIIVAGGPSLKRTVQTVARMQKMGATVFALNRVAAFLKENGIIPDAHALLDADPDVIEFVDKSTPTKRYYASQCSPSVLDAAGDELILWNSYMQGILDIVPDAPGPFVGGGTTIGTRAIGLAYMLGFRKIHIFGLDSSCEDGEGHAYSQIDFPSTLDVVFNGKKYRTPPQFLAQVEEFRNLLPEITANGCEITVHGDGLLPDVAASMLDPQPLKETA